LGLLDQEGKEIIPCEREAIIWDKKRGYNCTRRTEDNKKLEMHYNIEENYLKNGNYGVYDKHDIDEDPKKEKERIRLQLLNTKNPDGSKKWEWVDEADKNGLFKVTTLDEEYLLTKYGMMKDPDTVIIPCEYDKISLHKDGKYLATMPDREHIYDYEGTMHHYKLGDESNADRDEKIKAYRDLCNAGRREMVDEADKNGLFKVTTVNLAELEMKCGIMKDKDTEIIPCKYDKISLLPDGTYRCLLHGEEIIIAPQR
jgi:hypothetical protein